eukprot:jgi/Chrzof1/9888/Cz04g19220.t1
MHSSAVLCLLKPFTKKNSQDPDSNSCWLFRTSVWLLRLATACLLASAHDWYGCYAPIHTPNSPDSPPCGRCYSSLVSCSHCWLRHTV